MLFEKLEKELYEPVRELSRLYAVDDPNFSKQFENCVNSFIARNPQFSSQRDFIYNLAVAALQNYVIGRVEERSKAEILKIGLEGVKFLVGAYLKYKELTIIERETKTE